MAEGQLIAERYEELKNDRVPYTDTAEEAAELTLPYAYLADDHKAQDQLNRGYTQGFAAQLVNHLVGKLALTILPSNAPFYRLTASEEAMFAITQGDDNAKFEVERQLAIKEEAILKNINKNNLRASLYSALRLAVITGNCMIEKLPEEGYAVINLKNYVVKRDYAGKIYEFIIEEDTTYATLDEEFKSIVPEDDQDGDLKLYTSVTLEEGKYILRQELLGKDLGTEETFENFTDKFIDVGWNKIDGEDYRRGFIEDYLGTFIALEKLTQATFEGIAESVKIIKLVNPNGVTTYEDFVDAGHGDAIIGHESDVTTIQSQKAQDLSVAKQLIEEMKHELSKAFLVTGSSIRDSERTTAREVDIVAAEAEASLGGIYTSLSGDIQKPAVEQAMKEINIPEGGDIEVVIITGVQALGRNVELNKINGLIQELQLLAQIVGPEVVAKTVNVGAITSSIVANSGVAGQNFLYSGAEMEQQAVAEKEEAMAQQMMVGGMPQLGANVANDMVPQGGQQ